MWKVFASIIVLNVYVFSSCINNNQEFIGNFSVSRDLLAFNDHLGYLSQVFLGSTNSEPQKIRLMDDIKRSQSKAGLGTFLHFSGFIMSGIGIPLMMSEIKYNDDSDGIPPLWLSLSLAGTALSLVGPIPSLSGANKIEDSMEEVYENFYSHSYTGAYIKSIAFEGVAWMINILGTSLIKSKSKESDAGPIIIDVLFYSLYISAEAFRAKSAVGPAVYGKRAKEHMNNKAVKVQIFPIVPAGGGAGLAFQIIF